MMTTPTEARFLWFIGFSIITGSAIVVTGLYAIAAGLRHIGNAIDAVGSVLDDIKWNNR